MTKLSSSRDEATQSERGRLFEVADDDARSLTLRRILEVENQDWLLDLECEVTAIPVWPQVRIWFIRRIMTDLLYSSAAAFDPPAGWRAPTAATTLGKSVIHNHRLRRTGQAKSEIVITTEAMADHLVDGRWFNRMADPFAELLTERTLVLADQHEWKWNFPRTNPRTYLHAPLQTWSTLAGRVMTTAFQRAQSAEFADRVASRAEATLGWKMDELSRRTFARYVARKLGTTRFRYAAYRNLLEDIAPRVIVTSSACYGHIGTMIAAARDLGVTTAEFQHGAISEGHDAYNFAPIVAADRRLLRVMPQFFLSYGDWWSERINAPVQKRAIGYPARSIKLNKMGSSTGERKDVLILSDGVELPLYVDLARRLQAKIAKTGLRVVVRPHPMERSLAADLDAATLGEIEIDISQDIYESFARAHTVVSEVSTGLFEAVGVVKNVIILDTAKARFAFPNHPFAVATSTEEVADLITTDAAGPRVTADLLWHSGWQEAYLRFLGEVEAL